VTVRTSQATDKIDIAIREVQRRVPFIKKTAEAEVGSHYKYKYAPHEDVWEAVKDACQELGVTVVQGGREGANGTQWLVTRATCGSEYIEHDIRIEASKAGSQAMGAAWSYARRIGLLSLFGIVATGDDVDGVEAKGGRVAEPRQTKAARPAGRPKDVHLAVEQAREKLRRAETLADVQSVADSLNYVEEGTGATRTWVPKDVSATLRDEIAAKRKEFGG
jgi:hypothetical protein